MSATSSKLAPGAVTRHKRYRETPCHLEQKSDNNGIHTPLSPYGFSYRISPGTLYPLLHGLEQKGYLRSWEERNGRSRRRLFRATPKGHEALRAASIKIRELFTEIVGGE
jgi:DNA-binding PadR family transcriptional regulator